MGSLAADDGPQLQRRVGDGEVLARVGDALLGPEAPHDLHELPGAGVAVGLVALAVAVRGEVVLPGDDVDEDAAAGEVVQGGGGGREVRGAPVAGADRDEGLEGGGPGGERGGDGERVGPAPARAEERAAPAVVLQGLGVAGEGVQAVVALHGVVAAVPGAGLVGDVPEEFGAHMSPRREF
nr:hypothetical protein GCM10025732_04320 [Glycomyces mayteni]